MFTPLKLRFLDFQRLCAGWPGPSKAWTSTIFRLPLALRPEERWWLFGMTAITTGGGKDWRLALRHALGDVAQSELFKPRVTQTVSRNTANDDENDTLSLFDFEL